MPPKTNGRIVDYTNGFADGRYLMDDEYTEKPPLLTAIRIEKLLQEQASPYQHIAIYETTNHGKMLVLDGIIQLTMGDYFCYHEMMTHVPMAVLSTEPKTALVVGGGDGAMVNELGKYKSLEKIVWVDIDALVVEMCTHHFPDLHNYHDDRVEFIAMDGADIDYNNLFDLIIIDGNDFIGGAGDSLASEKFYQAILKALKPTGIVTTLSWWAWPEPDYYLILKRLGETYFKQAHFYWFLDPSMRYGHTGSFLLTNTEIDPTIPTYLNRVPLSLLQYYNSAVHTASFALPTCFHSAVGTA